MIVQKNKTNILLRSQSAAMFGLDARIALAIFGALSVITGAALYSVLGNIEVVTLQAEISEIGKAWEAYYLDTKKELPNATNKSTTPAYYHIGQGQFLLKDSGAKGWKGPYLPYSYGGDYTIKGIFNGEYDGAILYQNDDETWGNWNSGNPGLGWCTTGKRCFVWVQLWYMDNELRLKLDKKIDNSDGGTKGDFRWNSEAGGYSVYFKYSSKKNPNG